MKTLNLHLDPGGFPQLRLMDFCKKIVSTFRKILRKSRQYKFSETAFLTDSAGNGVYGILFTTLIRIRWYKLNQNRTNEIVKSKFP